jgi:hypothetical protein
MDAKARWTPVGTYAALTVLLVAIALGAAGLMHIAEHESIPWSALPMRAQQFAIGVEGVGLTAAIVLLGLLLAAFRLLGPETAEKLRVHLGLAVVLFPGVATHAALAVAHVESVPAESMHAALIALGILAACLVVALAVTGEMLRRGASSMIPRWLHAPLAIALALTASAHIVLAASHSAMHNSFV